MEALELGDMKNKVEPRGDRVVWALGDSAER